MKIFMCAVLLGGLWRLNEHYLWGSLRGYGIKASDPFLERRLWDVFPAEALRFWPFFLYRTEHLESFLEKALPVRLRTRMTGFGRFFTEINLLTPWLLLEWQGQVWCLSREGRMWNTADKSLQVGGMKIPEKPLWKIPPEPKETDRSPLPGGVFPLLFSTGSAAGFLKEFERESWFEAVEEIVLDRRGGADLFRLHLVQGSQMFTVLIQEGKYEWQELSVALSQILNPLMKEGGNYEIDATYENKIVVKNLPAGSDEGSSK